MNSHCSIANTQVSEKWQSIRHLSPFRELEQQFSLSEFDDMLTAGTLNRLKSKLANSSAYDFVCQLECQDQTAYYEQIIHTQKLIPTRRDSWHDLFNGLIWLQFPKTKALLNQWHIEDINAHGLNPRTRRRDQITHFDECGVIVLCDQPSLIEDLREHRFKAAMFDQRAKWGERIQANIFGHANYEMLLEPYLGLTGKWLPITPCKGYFDLPRVQQLGFIDEALYRQLNTNGEFCQSTRLSPLPLLGVPGWWSENSQSQFYDNTNYFRPKPMPARNKLKSQSSQCKAQTK